MEFQWYFLNFKYSLSFISNSFLCCNISCKFLERSIIFYSNSENKMHELFACNTVLEKCWNMLENIIGIPLNFFGIIEFSLKYKNLQETWWVYEFLKCSLRTKIFKIFKIEDTWINSNFKKSNTHSTSNKKDNKKRQFKSRNSQKPPNDM